MTDLTTWPTNREDADEAKWREMVSPWFRDGIHKGYPGFQDFQVYADSTGLQVKVKTGICIIAGETAKAPTETLVTLEDADVSNPRIDRVVLRLDRTDPATISIESIEGTAAVTPTAPLLTNTSTVTDVPLAAVRVDAGVSSIASNKITDERIYSAARGLASASPALIKGTSVSGILGDSPFGAAANHGHAVDALLLANAILPVGIVLPYIWTVAPPGYLLANGGAHSRATYSTLFSLIGTTHGEGNGTTTFNVPDYTGRFLSSSGGGRGNVGDKYGNDTAVYTHAHAADGDYGNRYVVTVDEGAAGYLAASGVQGVSWTDIDDDGEADVHNSLPKYAVVSYIIKAH